MASSDKPKKSKTRRLRAPSETVRQATQSGRTVKPAKLSKVRSFFGRIKGLKIWKPFKIVGRFLTKFLIPPYFKNSWRELRMVTWPNRKQTRQLTFAVILFSIVFGVLVALVDFGLDKLFKNVILHLQ
ncbi:MAG TPA: preprotein translocase subunit SecE [Candidatus Saccharimonadales bacterium]|nr:preprotein translocase subunit SecE [Candidatus Saccharimonadales bacterium]